MPILTKGVVLLALVGLPAHAQPQTHHRARRCPKLFTYAMGKRAANAIYRGTRNVNHNELLLLGRIEMCQRTSGHRMTLYDRHQAALWYARRHPKPPPAPSSGGGWAIPWPIVNCESGGHNDPPNGAGASGYYQIIPSTWLAYGGGAYASQAYLASKSAQDTIASRIWDGGRGASQWTCAGMTGY